MIAKRVSAALVPIFQRILLLIAGFSSILWAASLKLIKWVLGDFATVAGAAAIVWGIHFFGLPVVIGTPIAWISGGVLTIVFVALNEKPLR
jgi:hypothetical protein